MSTIYFGGIEGGATHSTVIICDQDGSIVSKVSGPGSNHWIIGIPEVARRISDMIDRAKTEANIEVSSQLRSLGLSLSGCEQEATNKALEDELRKNHPEVAESYYVCSDTIGSVFTASPHGGLVLIAGTGSNALLSNPKGETYNCGGWGSFLADEGSAWWISYRAIKTVFDDMDGLNKSAFDTKIVWQKIKNHFKIESQHDLLDHCYAKFDKAFFAGLCASLAESANQGDPLSVHLFTEAGRFLAKSAWALLPKVCDELLENGEFSVVCVGSVWKSWHLLEPGFTKEIDATERQFGLKLLRLTQSMAIGAAYIAADAIKFDLPRNYANNYEVFHRYGRWSKAQSNGTTNGTTNGTSSGQTIGNNESTKANGTLSIGNTTTGTTTNGVTKKFHSISINCGEQLGSNVSELLSNC